MWLSVQGRTVATSRGFFASVWQEYSYADRRWAVADAGIVSVELLTVVLTGPLAAYTAWLVLRRDAGYHVWLVLLCGAELYGDYVRARLTQMTFVPEWLAHAPVGVRLTQSLSTDNPLHLYFYLVASNRYVARLTQRMGRCLRSPRSLCRCTCWCAAAARCSACRVRRRRRPDKDPHS